MFLPEGHRPPPFSPDRPPVVSEPDVAMSQPNLFIANGTCYTGKGAQADSAFIPCGYAAFDHLPCCSRGDMCLADRACYNGQFGTTYLIGCTDPEYRDDKCPQKQFGEFCRWR